MKKILLCLCVLLAAATFCQAADGYLFVTFRGEKTPMTEQIYFGLSRDGKTWEALKGGEPVLVSDLGEKGVRDPYLLRTREGKFVILATDLSINLNPGWGRAVHNGSKSLVIWESNDLVHWSSPRLCRVAADDAGCTWAPEAIYDEDAHDYLVFWASTNAVDQFKKQRIWACHTADFRSFGKPFIYQEKPVSLIDTDIVRDGGKYYRFTKDETYKAITMETAEKLAGPWTDVPGFTLSKSLGFEGPCCYLLAPAADGRPAQWCLLLDAYAKGQGYKPFVTDDIASGQFQPIRYIHFPFLFRHGSVLPVSAGEYDALEKAYGAPAKP